MTSLPRRDTAKIYQFPHRPRIAALEAQRSNQTGSARLVSVCDYGAAWYHEAAVQEDLRGRKP